jgi:hypothetical protein
MEMTRYDRLSRADQYRGLPAPHLEKPVPEDARFISLPQPMEISIPPLELRSAIESRRSIRKYSGDTLTRQELAYLLWCTQGIVERHDHMPHFVMFRPPEAVMLLKPICWLIE